MHYRAFSTIPGIIVTVALLGCSESSPPQFHLDRMNVIVKQISPNHQKGIANILGAMFGSPDQPFAMPETGLNQTMLEMAAGPVWSDEEGGKHGLYRRHCAHCHGISGDGHGPTASVLDPYPRDYRPGVFKFKSTYTAAQPTHEDLKRILHDGIPGTAMPSFALLPPDEVESLVEYVKYLSMRGQLEAALEDYVFDEGIDPEKPLDPATDAELRGTIANDLLPAVLEGWKGAGEQLILPENAALPPADRALDQVAKSVDEGRALFFGTKANCVKCHGPTALGDGQQDDFDIWSKAHKTFVDDTAKKLAEIESLKTDLAKAKGDEVADLKKQLNAAQDEYHQRLGWIAHMLPIRNAIPRNLREGTYRGGRRPVDLFWRVSAGIAGTPMPASGPATAGAQGTLTQEEIWKIVDYIQSLPYEPISRPLKRPIPTNTDNVN